MKKLLTVAAIWGLFEVAYQFGKGNMLGTLLAFDCTPDEAMTLLSGDERLRSKIIKSTAEWKRKCLLKEKAA